MHEKLQIAHTLEELNVDVIEAGFPIASEGDFESVSEIANSIKQSSVCALARALDKDIDTAAEALKNSSKPRIHTFIATSPIHMEKKLRMSPNEVIISATNAIKLAKKMGPGKTIVTILCDHGRRYASKIFNKKFLKSKDLPVPNWL